MAEVGSNVAAFLGKLWRMVEDQDTNDLISWSKNGQSFLIRNQSKFAKELLPKYYKHNNMASFIRQLNMYGFHKIVSPDSGGLKTTTNDEVEFSHTYFIRGHSYMLEHIKRKITKDQNLRETNLSRTDVVNKIIYDVKSMKGRQESFDSKLSSMKQENEALWRELSILRQKHMKQQQIVNKLINFLVSLVQPSRNGLSVKKINLPMIKGRREHTESFCSDDSNYESGAMLPSDRVHLTMEDVQDNSPSGPIIHELDSPDFLEDIDILQGADTMLASPLTVEKTPPEQSKVDVNLLSSNTENNPLLMDLVKDVITEEETLISVPPEQILPVDMKAKNKKPTSTANATSTVTSNTKRTKTKKSNEETAVSTASSVTGVFDGAKDLPKVRKRPHQSSAQKNGQDRYDFPARGTKLSTLAGLTAPTSGLSGPSSTNEFIDVNMIKVEGHSSPPSVEDAFDAGGSPHQLSFDPLNCFAESPSPSELDLHCSLSSSPPNPSENQCLTMYKSPSTSMLMSQSYMRPRENFDSHIDSIQNDLDSLKDIMKGEGISLDASTLLNLFESTEPSLLPQFKSEDSKSFPEDCSDNIVDNKIASYAPSIDFSDMFPSNGMQSGAASPQAWNLHSSPTPSASLLEVNTPLGPPMYDDSPSPIKRRKT